MARYNASASGIGGAEKVVDKDGKPIQGFEDIKKASAESSKGWKPVSDRKIRVGIVGYGFCKFGAAFGFQDHPNVEVVAVSDLFPDRRDGLAKDCRCEKTYDSLEELVKRFTDRREVAVLAGFQGVHKETGRITTLGRGGSDTSAVAIAAAIGAERCDIYTDVDGVYTSDPRIVPRARRLDRIAYEEMLELASLGAKVMQVRSVELGMVHNVRIFVRSSFEKPEDIDPHGTPPGTLICGEEEIVEQQVVTGIAFSKDEAQISIRRVQDKPGIAAAIFGPLADANINVDMIVQNVSGDGATTDLTFTVPASDYHRATDVLIKVKNQVGYDYMTGAPIELTQANVRRRLFILAKAVAMCTEACSFLLWKYRNCGCFICAYYLRQHPDQRFHE